MKLNRYSIFICWSCVYIHCAAPPATAITNKWICLHDFFIFLKGIERMRIDFIKGINGCVCLVLFFFFVNQGYILETDRPIYGQIGMRYVLLQFMSIEQFYWNLLGPNECNSFHLVWICFVASFPGVKTKKFQFDRIFFALICYGPNYTKFWLRLGGYILAMAIDILVCIGFKWRLILNVA